MKIAYNLLQEYIASTSTPEELANKLRVASCEVESVNNWSNTLSGLSVGKVLKVIQHPQADRLRIATVSLGDRMATIVCGAANLAEGLTVVVALPGTTIHPLKGAPFTIETAMLRGVRSEGMLCGADEIGLDLAEEGIMVLPNTIKAGSDFAQALNLNTSVLDLEITPNRPDLLSYRGIAREIAALEKKKLKDLPIASFEAIRDRPSHVSITIDDSRLCNRYSALCLENVRIEPSPLWLQARLLLSGIRPVNTVVDITNYVMIELGQPLHAFDLEKIGGDKTSITVRGARKGERIMTLDKQDHTLAHGDIVITDHNNHPIAIAGIMGGDSSAISSTTTTILLESAHFLGSKIRRTSRSLGLRSEASSRFEKELDPEATVTALKRAAYLLQEIAGGTIKESLIDCYPSGRIERQRIHLSFARIQQILGVHISSSETKMILHYLGFQIPSLNKSSFEVIPPSWRKDVSLPEDVIEELIRIWGFDRLPATLPAGAPTPPVPAQHFNQKEVVRKTLASLGYHETIHVSMSSAKVLEKATFNVTDCIKLPNPLSEETAYLVPSHLPHFLESCAGVNAAEINLRLFELGHVFKAPLIESSRLSSLLRSNENPEKLYRQAKADYVRLLAKLGHMTVSFQESKQHPESLQKNTVISIYVEGIEIGRIGLVSKAIINSFKIKRGQSLVFVEVDLAQLLSLTPRHAPYRAASIFPSSKRDITAVVDMTTPANVLNELLSNNVNTSLVAGFTIEDIYVGKPLKEGKKSITMRFSYNAGTRTLTDQEIVADQERLIKVLRDQLNAEVL